MKMYALLLLALLPFAGAYAETTENTILNDPSAWYQFAFEAETGFLKIFNNTLQIGEAATNFNFVTQGGEEILFPFCRFNASVTLFKNNRISFLYQPLTIETVTRVFESITIDDLTFPVGTSLNLKYGFPFYRFTYVYDFYITDYFILGAGAALQLRNASIIFQAQDGSAVTVSQNLGPVPALVLSGKYIFSGGIYVYAEATGIYATSAFINGADFEFEGSLLDASIRLGLPLRPGVEAYFNLRFVGGNAKGTTKNENKLWSESVNNFTANYLATGALSLGLIVK